MTDILSGLVRPFLSRPSEASHAGVWTRRAWVARTTGSLAALLTPGVVPRGARVRRARYQLPPATAARLARQADPTDHARLRAFARQAVEAAQAAGAQYADVRLTRTVGHLWYGSGNETQWCEGDVETVGCGVRVLVKGYWGFSACPFWIPEAITPELVVRLAQAAVAQAKLFAQGPPRVVELGPEPVVTGEWVTPIKIDPFRVSPEEKIDFMASWSGVGYIWHRRQERILATSGGTLTTQTVYTHGSTMKAGGLHVLLNPRYDKWTQRLLPAGIGWEQLLETIPDMLQQTKDAPELDLHTKSAVVGRYTLVCDGQTMASLLGATLGAATQLDRALGYEANAGGTSFLDDPLAMVGQLQVTSPLVTVTADRSAPAALATVQWDDEGVAPQPFTLVKDGVLTDFQTNREASGWLAPYYQRTGQRVQSHGCAGSEDALVTSLQMMPNLILAPSATGATVEEMIAAVPNGLFIHKGAAEVDFQARNGTLGVFMQDGSFMQEIKNGQLGKFIEGGVVSFHTSDLWTKLTVLGNAATTQRAVGGVVNEEFGFPGFLRGSRGNGGVDEKGQPAQATPFTLTSVAATIEGQAFINPAKRG